MVSKSPQAIASMLYERLMRIVVLRNQQDYPSCDKKASWNDKVISCIYLRGTKKILFISSI